MTRMFWGLALICAAAMAQADTNSITISETRTLAAQADQAVFSISYSAPPNAGLQDAVNALAGTGITAANLSGVSGDSQGVVWGFSITVPLEKVNATAAALEATRKTLGQNSTGIPYLYYFVNTGSSAAAQAALTCPWSDMVSDARKEAQTLASKAGLFLGPIVGATDGYGGGATFINGDFAALVLPISGVRATLVTGLQWFQSPPVYCSLAVKFSLLH